MNFCSKPGCGRPGAAVLAYDYAASTVLLDDPPRGAVSPHTYVLCGRCAGSLRPPRGWVLEDYRSKPAMFVESSLPPAEADDEVVHTPPHDRRQLAFGYNV